MAAPGVLWVASRVAASSPPSDSTPLLTAERFCDWYEKKHIYEVTSLPGVPGARRYEAISPQPPQGPRRDMAWWSGEAPWLTLYEMADVDYRLTDEFRGLDGQSEPSKDLLEEVFKQARFDTRFYEEMGRLDGMGTGQGESRLLRLIMDTTVEARFG